MYFHSSFHKERSQYIIRKSDKTTPHVAKPIKLKSEPVAKRYKIAGAITIDEPTNGISDAKAETAPQRIGLGTEKIAKPNAVKNPFIKAIASEPRTIEFMDNPTFLIICSS